MQTRMIRSTRSFSWQAIIVWLVPVVLLIAGMMFWRNAPRSQAAPPSPAVPTSAEIEARWGVRISHIGVTADGGLIDLRYVVLDSAKAIMMLENLDTVPKIIAADQQTTLSLRTAHHHKGDLEVGHTYYILYRNVKGSVMPQTLVTVVIGDLKLNNFPTE
ncbi:MAG: hypothetical protein KAX40_09780 [Herpetosiphon sp.]|nr:hypothetical protein [Herpetosiphon sp.]